jgi:uncharacterized protein (TIGR03083 family)
MSTDLDYLDHLVRESARFSEALRDVQSDARVPTCPDWDAVDLLWHLGRVQWFWGEMVRRGITEDADADKLESERPVDREVADRKTIQDFYDESSRNLAEALAAPPETPAWTWAPEHTVGFIRRRQAHEALIHRLDAELTAGDRTPMDTALCSDGVDEALRVMYGGAPSWGEFTPAPAKTVRFTATDTGATWFITLGRFVGTDPDDNSAVDEPDIRAADTDTGGPAAATVSGTAADLDCWLWHRPVLGEISREGDESVLADLAETVPSPIN